MASANVVFGKVSGPLPVLDWDFTSQALASGATSSPAARGHDYVRITAIGGGMYAALSVGTPDAGNNPRVYIPAETSIELAVTPGTKVKVADA